MPSPAIEVLTLKLRIVVTFEYFELDLSDTTQIIDFLKLFNMITDFHIFTSQEVLKRCAFFFGGGHG